MLKVESYESGIATEIEQGLKLPHLIARILAIRGIKTTDEAERFLYPKVEHLSDPFLLPDIEEAVNTVIEAVRTGAKIALFGDYDADGITSTALMLNFLKKIGVSPHTYIPGRVEGYGLNIETVKSLKEQGIELLICLDCGSSNVKEIEAAKELGMDTVVIDHHEVSDPAPRPKALVNPKRKDSVFPTREPAACGVTFFFLLALRRTLHRKGLLPNPMNLKRELDLVTVGTVADMVPLTGDNRILVKFGMEMMRKQPRMWLRSFFRQGILYHEADGYALSFIIVPRINAAGRVSNPVTALQFLTSQEEEEADRLLLELDKANRQRQGIEEGIVQEALRRIETENLSGRCSLVLYKEDWPIGVLGIVAQKLAENYGKPCIVFTRVNGTWKGSARGVPGLDLHGTVSTLSPLLLKYGGHKFACGLSLKEENLSRFPEAFEEAVKECLVEVERAVKVDAIIEFDDLTRELVEYIELLAPFGMGNPRPGLLLTPSSVSLTNRFVKLTDQKKRTWRGYLQKRTALPDAPDARVVACPAIKEEMGEKFIQLHVREFVTE